LRLSQLLDGLDWTETNRDKRWADISCFVIEDDTFDEAAFGSIGPTHQVNVQGTAHSTIFATRKYDISPETLHCQGLSPDEDLKGI
jgi:hypothetical protein